MRGHAAGPRARAGELDKRAGSVTEFTASPPGGNDDARQATHR